MFLTSSRSKFSQDNNEVLSQNGTTTNSTFYGYTNSTDTPAFIRDANWSIVERYIDLPGDTLLTIRPGSSGTANKVFSLGNIHGDVFATTNASGTSLTTYQYDPFGTIISASKPGNMFVSATMAYVGSHQKLTEKDLSLQPINMGARGYIPKLGRFLQVDPIEGGVQNNYIYPPDAVNEFDLTGMFGWSDIKQGAGSVGRWAWNNREGILTGVGITACVVGTAGICLGAAVAGAAISGVAAGASTYRQTGSFRKSAVKGVAAGGLNFAIGRFSGTLTGAKHTVRHFGNVGGKARHYRSTFTALSKKAGKSRAYKQASAGALSWGVGWAWDRRR